MKCISKGCKTQAYCRGLCRIHYAPKKSEVQHRRVTWAFLELCGEVLPPKNRSKRSLI
jgi:hypothetical protein